VDRTADAVASQPANDGEPAAIHLGLDGAAHLADQFARAGDLQGAPERLPNAGAKPSSNVRRAIEDHRPDGIGHVPRLLRRHVELENISACEAARSGNAVHHFVVDGDAADRGKGDFSWNPLK
jgi:hypothetical protein